MIALVWRGKGFLVLLVVLGISLAANLLANLFSGSGTYWDKHHWPFALSLVISAISLWFLGRFLNKKTERVLIDKETGKEVVLKTSHDFFFIKVQYWVPILLVFALVALVLDLSK